MTKASNESKDARDYFTLLARIGANAESAKAKKASTLTENDIALMQAMAGLAKELLDWSHTAKEADRYLLRKHEAQLAVMAMLGRIYVPELPAAAIHVADAVKKIRDSKGELSITQALEGAGHRHDWTAYSKFAGFIIAGQEASGQKDGFRIIKEVEALVRQASLRKGGRSKKTA